MTWGSRWQPGVALIATVAYLASTATPGMTQVRDELRALASQVSRLQDEAKYPEAAAVAERYVALARQRHGEDHPGYAGAIGALGSIYRYQGRYAEAEPLMTRALAIAENALGPDHPEVGTALNYLAELYFAQGRYAEAELLLKRALAIRESTLGREHADVGESLNNLAAVYRTQGRYAEAEPLYKRALAITEKALGPDHPSVGTRLTNLAFLYHVQRRYSDAEPLYKRALAIREVALGPDHPDISQSLNNLADLYRAQRRFTEAEQLHKRSLAITEKVLGPEHPEVGIRLNNLGLLYQAQGRFAEAEQLFKRALAVAETALGPDHPSVRSTLGNLAWLDFAQSDWAGAARYWRRGTALMVRRAQRGTAEIGQAVTGKRKGEAEQSNWQFSGLVKVGFRLAAQNRTQQLVDEMFQTAQWARGSEAAASLMQMAARGAKGDAKLALVVRERQDLVEEWQKRDAVRSTAASQSSDKRDKAAETANVARLDAIDARIATIDKQLITEFPDYAALARSVPLSLADVRDQLSTNEALVLFLDTPEWKPTSEETFIWVVTKSETRWVRSELGTTALTREVTALRCGLDEAAWADDRAAKCTELGATSDGGWRFAQARAQRSTRRCSARSMD